MPRVLMMQRTTVPAGEVSQYRERIRARREHYELAGCRYWVFEETQLSGVYMEFVEAGDEPALVAAIAAAPGRHVDAGRIYQEVELD